MHTPHMSVQAFGRELKPEMWIFRFLATLKFSPADVTLGPTWARSCSLPSALFPGPHLVLSLNFCTMDQLGGALFKALIRFNL